MPIARRAVLCVAVLAAAACSKPPEFAQMPEDALVVDVRTPSEYASDHYPGAINVPLSQIDTRLDAFGDKDRPIVVYCRSGHRSAMAKQKLTAAGFTNVRDGGALSELRKVAPPQ